MVEPTRALNARNTVVAVRGPFFRLGRPRAGSYSSSSAYSRGEFICTAPGFATTGSIGGRELVS